MTNRSWRTRTSSSRLRQLTAMLSTACCVVWGGACSRSEVPKGGDSTVAQTAASEELRPDVLPVIVNKDLPFRYPPALYAEKTQGNVTLRLYIDQTGTVVDDSTRIAESSNVAMLDSAAIKGAHELKFVPAKLKGAPVAVSILFPVYFRHPEATPLAGDSVLKKNGPVVPSAPVAAPQVPVPTAPAAKSTSTPSKPGRKK